MITWPCSATTVTVSVDVMKPFGSLDQGHGERSVVRLVVSHARARGQKLGELCAGGRNGTRFG